MQTTTWETRAKNTPASVLRTELGSLWTKKILNAAQQSDLFTMVSRFCGATTHHKRIDFLMKKNQDLLLIELLKKMSRHKEDHCAVMHAMLKKGAEDSLYTRYKKMDPYAYSDIWWYVGIRFLIKKSRPEEAYSLWKNLTGSGQKGKKKWGILQNSIIRDLYQQGQKYKVEGNKKDVKKLCDMIMGPLFSDPEAKEALWEFWWLKGLAQYALAQNYSQAVKFFEKIIAYAPSDSEKILPAGFFPHYIAALFFAGMSHDANNNKKSAQAFYAQAARYPCHLYGQLACIKMGKPCLVTYTKGNKEKAWKHTPAILKCLSQMTPSMIKRHLFFLIEDFLSLCKTQDDAAFIIDFIQQHETPQRICGTLVYPQLVYFCSKLFARKGEAFASMYPVISFPVISTHIDLAHSIALWESSFNTRSASGVGAEGMMQVMPRNIPYLAKQMGINPAVVSLNKVNDGLRFGMQQLHNMLEKSADYTANKKPALIITVASYNSGLSAVKKWHAHTPAENTMESAILWIESIPYKETRKYVINVLSSRNIYSALRENKSFITHEKIQDAMNLWNMPCYKNEGKKP